MKQILDYNDKEIAQLVTRIVNDGQVVLHEQNLTQKQYAQVCERMGEVEKNDYFMNPPDNPEISIVSGELDENKKPIGMFRDQELQWHSNGTGRHNFKEICVGLYCVTECVDTVLTICNQRKMFEDLSKEEQDYYRTIDIRLDNSGPRARLWPKDSDYEGAGEGDFRVGQEHYKEDVDRRPLIGKHPIDGKEYLYFMVPYIVKSWSNGVELDNDALWNELWKKMFKSKYMFHHVFRKGDLLFMDQLHTIHRRSPIKNLNRKLWRTAFDYSNTKF